VTAEPAPPQPAEGVFTPPGAVADRPIVITHERQIDGDNAEVFTKVITPKGEEVAINYKLHQVGGDWKAYDVVVENISLVNNYRSQFNRVLANASFDELMRRLQQKSPDVKGSIGKG